MSHGKHTMDYIRIQIMVGAMESLLTYEQRKRILRAAEWGGFDAGMKSLTRVSDQMAKAQTKAEAERSFLEGRIEGLQIKVRLQTERAEFAEALAIKNAVSL
jgi:hypothetical protein